MSTSATPRIVAVLGPTATGKSALAIRIAQDVGGEIINADAMALYRGMDIGTAKVPPTERGGIAHHQLDVLEVRDEASLAAYQRHARADIDAILNRAPYAIVVGGSGLYLRALLDDFDIPPTDAAVRSALEARAAAEGVAALFAELANRDPAAAAAIDPSNGRRIVRALEVIELTGRPFSASLPRRAYVSNTVTVGLNAPRPVLDARIAQRVDSMWSAGLLDEVRALEDAGLRDGKTARAAIGYAQALAQVDGLVTDEQARHDTAAATRRLVRRQDSWFRPDPRITWFDATRENLEATVLEFVAAAVGHNGGHD